MLDDEEELLDDEVLDDEEELLDDEDVVEEVLEVVEDDELDATDDWVVEELLEACIVELLEVGMLVEDACDWLVEVFEGEELKARYPPIATTMTITTTTAATVVPIAFRLPPGTLKVPFRSGLLIPKLLHLTLLWW